MKYMRIGVGTEKVDDRTRRFMLDLGFESTKPSSEKTRNAVVATLAVVAFLTSIWLMQITDANTKPQQTIDLTESTPWH